MRRCMERSSTGYVVRAGITPFRAMALRIAMNRANDVWVGLSVGSAGGTRPALRSAQFNSLRSNVIIRVPILKWLD